jgi:hypothetical protein
VLPRVGRFRPEATPSPIPASPFRVEVHHRARVAPLEPEESPRCLMRDPSGGEVPHLGGIARPLEQGGEESGPRAGGRRRGNGNGARGSGYGGRERGRTVAFPVVDPLQNKGFALVRIARLAFKIRYPQGFVGSSPTFGTRSF